KYVVCNAAEGEPEVEKDGFILEKFPEEVMNGIKIAIETLLITNTSNNTSGAN
ncbi:MAG: hypothetical protein EOM76_12080, partial [Sphingobacteriia bacterium]|nr:hypothetical protein [Sphingobacteriia bacterium]